MIGSIDIRELGVRTKKSVLGHILRENTFDSNLISDISKVDYTKGSKGKTELWELEGLPPFVDDLYVYGYLHSEQCKETKRGLVLDVAGGVGKTVVNHVLGVFRELLGVHVPTKVVCTAKISRNVPGGVVDTVCGIEHATECRAKEKWIERYQKTPIGIVKLKVDTSELLFEDIADASPKIERHLNQIGYGLLCIDYTRDFSGTLNREEAIACLLEGDFQMQGSSLIVGRDTATILDTAHNSGGNTLSYMRDVDGKRTRVKYYNKIVCNFEAGEIQKTLGGHLAEYVDCPNMHLRRTFDNPDVQERGLTRLEISVYGFDYTKDYRSRLQEELDILSGHAVFHIQPARDQWTLLAREIDRSLVLANRTTGEIFHAWYGNSKTGRIAGVGIEIDNRSDKEWEKAVAWMVSEFGFRKCLIFRLDTSIEEDRVSFGKLRAFVKDGPTILTSAYKPTQLHPDAREANTYLPDTKHVSWIWRVEKVKHKIGVQKLTYSVDEVETNRVPSLLSTRKREAMLVDLRDQMYSEEWKELASGLHTQEVDKRKREVDIRNLEIEETCRKLGNRHAANTEFHRKTKAMETYKSGIVSMSRYMQDTTNGDEFRLIGVSDRGRGSGVLVLLENSNRVQMVYATVGMKRFLSLVENNLKDSKGGRVLYGTLRMKVGEQRSFECRGGTIEYYPLHVLEQNMDINFEGVYNQNEEHWKSETLVDPRMIQVDFPKKHTKAVDLPEGEYRSDAFATRMYRNKKQTVLYLDTGIVVYGRFLQEELDKICIEEIYPPLLCKFGRVKTTKDKNKDRIVDVIAVSIEALENRAL